MTTCIYFLKQMMIINNNYYNNGQFFLFNGCDQVHVRISKVICMEGCKVELCQCLLSGADRHRGGRFSEVYFILNAC